MQIPAGWLVDRLDVKWVFAVGLFIWSAATAVTGALHGFAALLIVRVILGLGESVAFPSYSKILCAHFRESRRGFANAMIMTGLALGPALGILVGGIAVARFGWRSFFVVLGLTGLLWLAPWLAWMPRRTEVVLASLVRWRGIPFHLAAEISMGHLHRPILHQLLLILSRDMAAVLPRTGTSSQHERNGEGGRPGLPNVGDLIGGDGKTGRSMDSSRSISNRGPQGMDGLWPRRHWRYVHFHYHDEGHTLHWNASPHGSLPRNQHLQQLGVPANPGRTSHGGSMGRSAELCGKSCRSRSAGAHRISFSIARAPSTGRSLLRQSWPGSELSPGISWSDLWKRLTGTSTLESCLPSRLTHIPQGPNTLISCHGKSKSNSGWGICAISLASCALQASA